MITIKLLYHAFLISKVLSSNSVLNNQNYITRQKIYIYQLATLSLLTIQKSQDQDYLQN